jgi:hypothetical protein
MHVHNVSAYTITVVYLVEYLKDGGGGQKVLLDCCIYQTTLRHIPVDRRISYKLRLSTLVIKSKQLMERRSYDRVGTDLSRATRKRKNKRTAFLHSCRCWKWMKGTETVLFCLSEGRSEIGQWWEFGECYGLYSVCYVKADASSSVGDVVHYVIVTKLLHSAWNVRVLPLFIRRWEVQTYLQRTFISEVGYKRCDVTGFIEQMNYNNSAGWKHDCLSEWKFGGIKRKQK